MCSGWRTFKRPGVEDFIRSVAQYYELVVYTSQLPTYADPILDRLDPQRMIQYR
jgi:import inner membrane translocase subunit TIM50